MKKLIISAVLALTLVAVLAVPAVADQSSKQASVTVNSVLSFTVTDYNSDGIKFGSLDQSTSDSPADGQDATDGTVSLSIPSETNVDCIVEIKGSGDFDDGNGHTISLGQATWKKSDGASGATPMDTTAATVDSPVTGGYSQDIWHWITIPSSQAAGTYTTNFVYSCNEVP